MKISNLAISHYQFTVIIFVLFLLSGAASFLTMPRSEDPQVTPKGTSVIVIYPGANPLDMEELVADPLEEKINELDDIKRIESTCADSIALTAVQFYAGVDMDEIHSELVQKVTSIRNDLPEGITDLEIRRWNISDFVIILQVALESETASFRTLDEEAERLKRRLEKVYGVKKVQTWAIPEQEVRISLDLNRLSQQPISLNQISSAIKAGSFNIPGGNLDLGGKRFNINTSGSFRSLEDLRDTIVHAAAGKVVRLKDIAVVDFDYADSYYYARSNGRRSVFITVKQKEGTNIFSVMEGIDRQIAEFRENLPASVTLTEVFDQSRSVSARMNIFFSNLLQGLLLVGVVILLAVGLRAAVIVMLAIPISILTALGLIDLVNYGLQQMVIVGLVIALGLLVDNAIVVIENISRFMKMGYNPVEAAVKGTGQIGGAIVSSTLTTVLAFIPIALMGQETGDYIRSMPVTVVFALLASLLVALTLTPFLSSRFLQPERLQKEGRFRRLLRYLIAKTYRPTLDFALTHPRWLTAGVTVAFLGSLSLFQFVGVSLFPKAEKPQIIVNVNTPEGSNLDYTDGVARFVESHLQKIPEIKCYAANIGRGNPQIHYNVESAEQDVTHAQFFIEFVRNDQKMIARLVREMRRAFRNHPGAEIEVKEIEQGPHVEAPVAIKILGENLDVLRSLAADVEAIFHATPGTLNINNPQRTAKTELKVDINRAKAGMLGIPLLEIDRTVRTAIAGMPVSSFRDAEGKEYDIVLRLPFEDRPGARDLSRIQVSSLTGAHIPLRQVADVNFTISPKQIDHFNFDRTVTITADVESGYSVDRVTTAIIEKLEDYPWPRGYDYYISGQRESREESFGGMGKAILIALIAIFAVLVLQFRSFSQPLIVYTAIPLAVIGSILALLITGNTFSFTAFIGLTSLVGIVVNNSIILVDYANKLRSQGKDITAALKEAGETRFIPIVLTTATTIGGLLPLTLRGGTMWGPMGWTIIGGLVVSTFLTLIVVPVLYKFFTPKNRSHPRAAG